MPASPLERTDLLVVGCGIAGMTAALVAAVDADVVLVTKGPLLDSASAWASINSNSIPRGSARVWSTARVWGKTA